MATIGLQVWGRYLYVKERVEGNSSDSYAVAVKKEGKVVAVACKY